MAADNEALFTCSLSACDKCLRLLRKQNQSDDLATNEYTRHISGAKDSPLLRIRLYNVQKEGNFTVVPKIVKRTFYVDDSLYSAEYTRSRNPEAIFDYAYEKR